jgi:hypothetical protein
MTEVGWARHVERFLDGLHHFPERSPSVVLKHAREDADGLAAALAALRAALAAGDPDYDLWCAAMSIGFADPGDLVDHMRGWERLLTAVAAAVAGTASGDAWPAPWLAAVDPGTGPDRLRQLAAYRDENKDTQSDLNMALAEHPATPLDVLLDLAGRDDLYCRIVLAARRPLHPDLFALLLGRGRHVHGRIGKNPTATPEMLTALAEYERHRTGEIERVMRFLEKVNFCGPGCGCSLDYFDRSPSIVLPAAREDPACVADALSALRNVLARPPIALNDTDFDMWTDATNGAVDTDAAGWLTGWERLLSAAAAVARTPRYVGGLPGVWSAAIDPATTPDRLRELAQLRDVNIDAALAENPATPLDVQLELVDRDTYELWYALACLSREPAVLSRLAGRNDYVDEHVAGNPAATLEILEAIVRPPTGRKESRHLDSGVAVRILKHPACTSELRALVYAHGDRDYLEGYAK